jgi:hypothetical protein
MFSSAAAWMVFSVVVALCMAAFPPLPRFYGRLPILGQVLDNLL